MAKGDRKAGQGGSQPSPAGTAAGASGAPGDSGASAGTSIDIATPPYLVGETRIKRIVVTQLTFVEWVTALRAADATRQIEKSTDVKKYFQRERMKRQVKAYADGDALVTLSALDIMQMPRAYAMSVVRALDMNTGMPGEVISEGDGVTSPILYKLSRPLRTNQDSITELEFSGRTLGDIEDVIAADTMPDQALALIRTCAKPVGGEVNLIALPSWAVDAVSLVDGLTILEKVLPRFLA